MASGLDTAVQEPIPAPEPQRHDQARTSPGEWVKANLFNSWPNSVLTVVFGGLVLYFGYRGLRFVFVTGRWDVVEVNLTNFMVGRYPRGELHRLWAAIYLAMAVTGLAQGVAARRPDEEGWRNTLRHTWPLILAGVVLLNPAWTKTWTPHLLVAGAVATLAVTRAVGRRLPFAMRLRRRLPLVVLLTVLAAYLIITAGGGVPPQRWGGLLLTVTVSLAGIVLSFPLGLLLGLGRRSSFPLIRAFSIGYIELFRGVPLVSLLFIGATTIGLFLPPGRSTRLDLVFRALIAIILFTGAYLAETVRGGLQSVPRGQEEAAKALGLSPFKTMRLIVLPQALRNVIPTLVGQFISLYKDTSLLAVIGLFEILGIAQLILVQDEFRGAGLQAETLMFAAFLFWTACYSMSRASQRLEKRLGVGER